MRKQQQRGYTSERKGPEVPSLLRILEAVRKSTGNHARPHTRIEKAEERLARAKRLQDEGRLAAPRAKVPLTILKGMRKKRGAREARAENARRHTQVQLLREQRQAEGGGGGGGEVRGERRENARAMVGRHFAGDKSGLLSGRRGLAPSLGHFSAGTLRLTARDAARLNARPKRPHH